jgi:archaellum component FlaD/FlaE
VYEETVSSLNNIVANYRVDLEEIEDTPTVESAEESSEASAENPSGTESESDDDIPFSEQKKKEKKKDEETNSAISDENEKESAAKKKNNNTTTNDSETRPKKATRTMRFPKALPARQKRQRISPRRSKN